MFLADLTEQKEQSACPLVIISEEGSFCSVACFYMLKCIEMFVVIAINFPV